MSLGHVASQLCDAGGHIQFKCALPLQTLAELGESLKLLESLQGHFASTEAQIALILELPILDKYGVPVEQND